MNAGKKLMDRLRSRAGESIAEVLIAVLISALGMAILAGMVAASSNIVRKSKAAMQTYIVEENKLAAQSTGGETGSIMMTVEGTEVRLPDSAGDADYGVPVEYYLAAPDKTNNKVLVSYSLKES